MSAPSMTPVSVQPLLPGQVSERGAPMTLGVMGGGQLGRMFVHAAQAMGYCTAVLDPDATSPAGGISHHHIRTAYDDPAGLAELARVADAITTEFENVPAQSLALLAQTRRVAPSDRCVSVAQDRLAEKALLVASAARSGVHPAPYAPVDSEAALAEVPDALLPGILKTARMGYDGKGQVRVDTREALAAAWTQLGRVPCVLEQRLSLRTECSVIVARSLDGAVVHFPVQRNLHRDGILAVTEVYEGNLPAALAARAVQAATFVAEHVGYVGVLCVEFFVVDDGSADGQLVVNEMAPRPHNSGHYTQNACSVSQFELQVRCMAGLPLVQPRLHSPSIMLNLLGDVWQNPSGQPTPPQWDRVLALPGAHLHLYGKQDPRAGRKMGHLNLTADSVPAVRHTAQLACELLGLPGF